MNKNKRSLIALNRNLFFAIAILFGLGVSGVIAWQVSATGGPRDNSKRAINAPEQNAGNPGSANQDLDRGAGGPSTQPVSQDEVRAIYRGVTTAARFDISPPLRVLAAGGSPEQRESRECRERTAERNQTRGRSVPA